MPRRSCDGAGFLAAFRNAVASLEANVDEVNALNVFPVPDGDTGSNMLATVRAALDEAERVGAAADAGELAHAAAYGALMGARGNSGVITSQILSGMASGLAGRRRFNGLDLAHALDAGTRTAYKAVARPVEGTILTVIREASVAAVAAAERDDSVEQVLVATVEAAERAVARTPSLLPILREAHVVDSGGQGLLRLFEGALVTARRARPEAAPGAGQAGRDEPARDEAATVPAGPAAAVPAPAAPEREDARAAAPAGTGAAGSRADGPAEEGAFGYETVFLVRARPGHPLDVPAIQAHLESIGDSVLVAGDGAMAKVHVHNERPDAVIAYGLSLGSLSRITVENLDSQAHEVREARAAAFLVDPAGPGLPGAPVAGGGGSVEGGLAGRPGAGPGREVAGRPATRLPLGVVAVAPSDGLAAILADTAAPFREHGAFRIVRGGQGANPSTGELLEAVRATEADELVILPNNPNVMLAARQVASMTDRPVHLVPTRNCAEGVAALFELDPSLPGPENAAAMTRGAHAVQTMQVTEAVRDATVSGQRVKRGQAMVLDPDDGLLAVDAEPDRAVLAALGRLDPGFSLVTVYYGDGATLDEAERLARRIHEAAPGLEDVEVKHGGQPHYRYLISAE